MKMDTSVPILKRLLNEIYRENNIPSMSITNKLINFQVNHNNDVIMGAIASQITSLTIVF